MKTEIGYHLYWRFAYERQLNFKEYGLSQDEIIKKYKFTNCYRFLDRTSQFLIKNIINKGGYPPEDIFFRVILFKIFNKIETWVSLTEVVGEITIANFSEERYCNAITEIKNQQSIYSAAYIIPSGIQYGSKVKHINNIKMLGLMLKKSLHKRVWDEKNLSGIYKLMLNIPSIGSFLAYQYAIDIAYSEYSEAQESDFVIAGPGAVRGIHKCFSNITESDYVKIIHKMQESQYSAFKEYNLDFKFIGKRSLQLIDCQNIFCELDKYLRVKHPELKSNRKKIKCIYKKKTEEIEYEFPKKWGIKSAVE